MSDPLILWAPSSAMLRSPESAIDAEDFLHLLETRRIVIVAREAWLAGPGARDPERWPGSKWDPEVDGRLRDFWENDKNEPPHRRRVLDAPKESGYEWAKEYFEKHPKEVSRWVRLIRGRKAAEYLPSETLTAARSLLKQPNRAAIRVLRDAHNHGVAYRDSGAVAPFLLDGTDRRFIEALASAPPSLPAPSADRVLLTIPDENDTQLGELVTQLVEILQHLDVHAGRPLKHRNLRTFIESEEHIELARWMKSLCEQVKKHSTRQIDDYVIDDLQRMLNDSRLLGLLSSLRQRKFDLAVGLAGAVTTLTSMVVDPMGPTNLVGAAVTAYPVAKGIVREIGYAPTAFEGPQWPFLYTYGRRSTKRDFERLKFVLAEFA
jgi:hypothetical protein